MYLCVCLAVYLPVRRWSTFLRNQCAGEHGLSMNNLYSIRKLPPDTAPPGAPSAPPGAPSACLGAPPCSAPAVPSWLRRWQRPPAAGSPARADEAGPERREMVRTISK